MPDEAVEEPQWGRLLLTGGIHWSLNGRKDRTAQQSRDLHIPHILRSLCDAKIVKIVTGHAANYGMAIDIRGNAWLFGKCPAIALGANTNGVISEQAPLKIRPFETGCGLGVKFVGGAAGKGNAFLLDSDGGAWGCGTNHCAQLGLNLRREAEVSEFTKIDGPWGDAKIVQITAGWTFTLFLTEEGEVYGAGSHESGQLGSGKTGARLMKANKMYHDLESYPILIRGLEGHKIVQIASGNQHSLAMSDDGLVWAWGCAGYSRLGLEDTRDRLEPTMIPAFAGREMSRASAITCGPTNSVVIDRSGRYWMAGKWKITGDGSTGQPYSSFKNIQEINGCRALKTSSGGCTHFITTPTDEDGIQTIGWGQGVLYGELGLGDTMSSTKPVAIEALEGVDVIDIAAGAFFTMFLARPGGKLSDLDRYPEHVNSSDICIVCEESDHQLTLECEKASTSQAA
ncbi:regulator of chromosome condensation 1/beta-lactamase-inhibitor protein II [Kockovaella imperatae]|uniref:Regulator of chromosome condensation 1/beta-lactamase-inhibitor protein II n=1 Tax=Kockovaella imperatae TaxID=4999 RepID=A0A1Y1URK6_9TREE|nr:regulator of chromosome condensation 1/beta-lactamase-inhibitor protein II [Kockovaella imperatae]ORX40572.1 regulator of chromosome condensation 1/beta-lactamase-inhibitor protein II [Kockovaella imperatae]